MTARLRYINGFLLVALTGMYFESKSFSAAMAIRSEEKAMADSDQKGKAQLVLPDLPELIVSTDRPFFLGTETKRLTLQIHEPTGPAKYKPAKDQALFLRIENYTCDTAAPSFAVFLNVPPGHNPEERDDLYAGSMGTFGLPEASLSQGDHGGAGKNVTLNVTRLYQSMLRQELWDPHHVTVVFMPERWDGPVPQVKVGRVSLYVQ